MPMVADFADDSARRLSPLIRVDPRRSASSAVPVHSGGSATILMLLALVGCNGRSAPIPLAGETMGTSWSVKLDRLPKGESSAGLKAAIVAALARFDRQMSTWRPDS